MGGGRGRGGVASSGTFNEKPQQWRAQKTSSSAWLSEFKKRNPTLSPGSPAVQRNVHIPTGRTFTFALRRRNPHTLRKSEGKVTSFFSCSLFFTPLIGTRTEYRRMFSLWITAGRRRRRELNLVWFPLECPPI